MQVKYADGPAARLVDGVGRVERGATADVSDEQGAQLLKQGWQEVKSTRTKSKTKTTATDAGKKEE